MIRIVVEVDVTSDYAIGAKELLMMAIEKAGVGRVVEIKDMDPPKQTQIEMGW